MPTTAKENAVETTPEYVSLSIPRGGPDDPDVYISVNGRAYILPRGKTSRVPYAVALEYKRGLRARDMADRVKSQRSKNSAV